MSKRTLALAVRALAVQGPLLQDEWDAAVRQAGGLDVVEFVRRYGGPLVDR